MNNKEAIKEIEQLINKGIVLKTTTVNIPRKNVEALEIAIEALEKQIPEKPLWEYLGDNLSRKEIITLCPCCYESIEEGEHHCKCGQVIDWSGEND